MTKSKGCHGAGCIAVALVWLLVMLAAQTNAQAGIHPTQKDLFAGCTRAPERVGSAGASETLVPCLSFEPLSTTSTKDNSASLFSSSKHGTSATPSSSTTVLQPLNSTSNSTGFTLATSTWLQDIEQVNITSSQEQVQAMTEGTLYSTGTANTVLYQNSTTDTRLSVSAQATPQGGGDAANATMFPSLLQTVTYTTTICPSGGQGS